MLLGFHGALLNVNICVDLAERSVRHGAGDAGLTEALRRDAEGDWE